MANMNIATTITYTLTWKPKKGPRVVVPDNRNAPRPEKIGGSVSYPHGWFEHRTLPQREACLVRLIATHNASLNGSPWFRAYVHPIVDARDAKGTPIRIPNTEALIGLTMRSLDVIEFCDRSDLEAITAALIAERNS